MRRPCGATPPTGGSPPWPSARARPSVTSAHSTCSRRNRMSVIVVTGASRGMGRAYVDRAVGRGHQVVAVDLDAPEIDGCVGVACDVSDAGAVGALAEQV